MNPNIKIAIAEPSAIIRCGLVTLLKRLPGLRIQLTEIATAECLIESLRMHRPEVLMRMSRNEMPGPYVYGGRPYPAPVVR